MAEPGLQSPTVINAKEGKKARGHKANAIRDHARECTRTRNKFGEEILSLALVPPEKRHRNCGRARTLTFSFGKEGDVKEGPSGRETTFSLLSVF